MRMVEGKGCSSGTALWRERGDMMALGVAGVQRPKGDLLKSGGLDTKPTQSPLTAGQGVADETASVCS